MRVQHRYLDGNDATNPGKRYGICSYITSWMTERPPIQRALVLQTQPGSSFQEAMEQVQYRRREIQIVCNCLEYCDQLGRMFLWRSVTWWLCS